MTAEQLLTRIRCLLIFFIVGLVLSGLTAFPLAWEVRVLNGLLGPETAIGEWLPAFSAWIATVHRGLEATEANYPFLFYGTDWLAFAHLVIAIAFWGPLRDPVRNVWVVEFGMIACVLVIPTVLICGPLRGIPPFWWPIDMAFGVVGLVPLWLARRYATRLAAMDARSADNRPDETELA